MFLAIKKYILFTFQKYKIDLNNIILKILYIYKYNLYKMSKQNDIDEISKSFNDVSLEDNNYFDIATDLINKTHKKKQERNIWDTSRLKNIAELECDDVGKVGEEIISKICQKVNINSSINGTKTKQIGGGKGDGKINEKTVEIKTARLGSNGSSFQHELGEVPWKAEYMIFLDISPKKIYITIFPNFSEEFYKKSGSDSSNKCNPYFPTKSITWRKQKGAFKLDTTININEKNKYTFKINESSNDYSEFKQFVNKIISIL